VKQATLFEVSVWRRDLRQTFSGTEPRDLCDSSSVFKKKFLGIHKRTKPSIFKFRDVARL
jgi:hypothetical protein